MSQQDHENVEFSWGGRAAVAELRRSTRRVLRIELRPTGKLVIFAPLDAELEVIQQRLHRRGPWIFRELDKMSTSPIITPERRFVSGETHLFLGRQYRLSLVQGDDAHVKILGDRIVVTTRNLEDPAQCRRLISAFHTLEARKVFRERMALVFPAFQRKGVKPPALIIRRMSKRWGSYTPGGRIVLNTDLVRANPAQIDYVICHELVHAIYPDHGKNWRDMLTNFMPDWEARKSVLESELR